MKQIENNFAVSGFVGKDAEIRQFANASVARFSLAVSRQEKSGEETKRVSAFINVEAWRNNANTDSLAQITKGILLTVEGYFKPEEWIDKDGVKLLRSRNRKRKKARNNSCLVLTDKAASVAFVFARMFTCYTSMGCPL